MTRKESPSGTTSSTSQVANCSMTFCASNASISGVLLGADLRQQRGVDILAVRDRRFGDPAPELLHHDLAAALAFGPFVVGGEADPDGLHTVRAAELNRNRSGRVENRSVGVHRKCPLLADGVHAALADRREDAVGGVVDRQALDRDREDLVRLRRSRPRRRRPSATSTGASCSRRTASVMTAVPVVCALSFVYSVRAVHRSARRTSGCRRDCRIPACRGSRRWTPSPAVWKPEPGKKPASMRMLFFQPVSRETMFLLVT